MFKSFFKASLLLIMVTGSALLSLAQHVIDLTGNVSIYGQLQCNWCGAACGQMIMDGYPDPADRVFITQLNIWNSIQTN